MIAYFILGICVLFGLILLARWMGSADPKLLARTLKFLLVILLVGVVLVIVVGGRFALLTMLVGGLLPAIMRWRSIRALIRSAGGPTAGQQSEVGSRYLRMTLEHDTGVMTGIILEGPWQGRELSELSPEELIELMRRCRSDDPQSASLLEAWLDRARPDMDWRAAMAGESGGGEESARSDGAGSGMTRAEALRILGLDESADKDAIKAAHRRLVQKLHPDHGGSSYLAARINEAKDFLMRS